MVRGLVGLFLIASTSLAVAEPMQLGGESWEHSTVGQGDLLQRADGAAIAIQPAASASCSALPRASAATRYDWLAATYWPQVDTSNGNLSLCIQLVDRAVAVVLRPAGGKPVDATFGTALRQIADELRPPVMVKGMTIRPSLPPAAIVENGVTMVLDDKPVGFGIDPVAEGTCAYDFALVATKLGQPSTDAVPPGYWGPVFKGDKTSYVCTELKNGYVSVLLTPSELSPPVLDVLAEIARAGREANGAPIGNAVDATVLLPRTQQQVTLPGMWKAIDGEREKIAGDVLASTADLGSDGFTMFSVGITEGSCTPGTSIYPAYDAEKIFPSELGTVWLDDSAAKLRWKASACVSHGEQTATISVLASFASNDPPTPKDAGLVRALVDAIARSYGIDVKAPAGGGGGGGGGGYGRRGNGKATGHADLYGGVIGVAPDMGDRRYGGLAGFNLRFIRGGGGPGAAVDVELGYGGGEWIGEIRGGGGFGIQTGTIVLDGTVGVSIGSTGPSASVDAYADASFGLYSGKSLVWFGAMKAWGGGDGLGHTRFEVRLGVPNKDTTTIFGLRYLRFDKSSDMMPTGDAFLLTFGGGISALN